MHIIKKLSLLTVLFLGMSLHSNSDNRDSTANLVTKGILYGCFTGFLSNIVVTAANGLTGGFPLQIVVWPAAYMLRTTMGEKSTKKIQDEQIVNYTSFLAAWATYFVPLPVN